MRAAVLILFLLVLPFSADAQLFRAGPIIGINGSQIQGDGFRGFRKMGLNIGVGFDVLAQEKFSFGLELLYSQKGSKLLPSALSGGEQQEYIMDYLEVPIIFKYRDAKGMDFGGGICVGRSVRNVYRLDGLDDSDNRFGTPNVDNSLNFEFFGDATYNLTEIFRVGFRWSYSLPVVKVNENRIGRHSVISLRLLTYFGAVTKQRK